MTLILWLRRPSIVDTGEQKIYSTFEGFSEYDADDISIKYRTLNGIIQTDKWHKSDVIKIEVIL